MIADDKPIVQDINVVIHVKVQDLGDGKASVSIPRELRLTADAFTFIQRMVAEQGFQLVNMNVSPEHTAEVKDLPNVSLLEGPAE